MNIAFVLFFFVSAIYGQQDESKLNYRIIAINQSDSTLMSVSNETEVFLPSHLYIPTVFTPNGDGVNDEFNVKAKGITHSRLQVFNRYGELVFETQDLDRGWNGKIQEGHPVKGAYIYKLTGVRRDGLPVDKTGTVALVM